MNVLHDQYTVIFSYYFCSTSPHNVALVQSLMQVADSRECTHDRAASSATCVYMHAPNFEHCVAHNKATRLLQRTDMYLGNKILKYSTVFNYD